MTANLMLAPSRSSAPPIKTAPVQRVVTRRPAQVVVRADCCAFRGDAIGWIDCSCSGKPAIYACRCPQISQTRCMLHATNKRIKSLQFHDGSEISLESGQRVKDLVPICAICPHRRATVTNVLPAARLRFFRTSDLLARTSDLLQILPEVSAVVAIPRSGLLPASLIATARHVPLFTLRASQLVDVGAGLRSHSFRASQAPYLLIDDTTWSGHQMQAAASKIRQQPVIRAAVYAHDQKHVDYCASVVEGDFLVEWNLFNNAGLLRGHSGIAACAGGIAFDMDGVICEEPRVNDHADLPGFLTWLQTARPLHLPLAAPVKLICSGRLEGWRVDTEQWLARHNVRCDRLLLDPFKTVQERDAVPRVATRKGDEFRASDCTLFVESNPAQSPIIAEVAGKPVICLSTGEVF